MKYSLKEALYDGDISLMLENYTTSAGSLVEFGSQEHVDDIGKTITYLELIRKQMPRRTQRKERFTISRCIESLRHMRKNARKDGIKKGLIEILEE